MTIPTKPHIMIVDDSMVDLRLLTALLTRHGYRLSVAFNGHDAVQKIDLLLPDLILLDINMPQMNGLAACRLLKQNERTRHIPVIFLTAATDADMRLEGFAVGAVDFVNKPFHEEEVLARIHIHLSLANTVSQPPVAIHPKTPDSKDAALFNAAKDYMRQHISDPPSPEALAQLLGTHEKRLNQTFVKHSNLTLYAWLREERLRQACELLRSTDTPVAALSEYLGFSTQSNFAKAFKERFACSPSEYRQRPIESNPGQPATPHG
jgi:CheY-like chemotaxis protein/AraC-like DNA-binding protein